MTVSFNVFNIIIAFGMLQSFIFGIYLCVKSQFKNAQFYLGITVLFLSFYLFWVLKYDLGLQNHLPALQFLPILFISGIGPSFYIYLRFLFKKPISGSTIRWYFVPVLVEFIYYNSTTIVYWLNDWNHTAFNTFERAWVFNSSSIEHIFGLTVFGIFLFKSYRFVASFYVLFAHNKIRSILICFIALWAIWCVYVVFDVLYYNFTFPPSGFYLFYILFTVLTYTIGFFGFKINDDTFLKVGFSDDTKNEGSLEMKHIFENTERLMKTSKPYLNPDINLTDFSKLLGLHPNKVSAAINTINDCSFRDYINLYRIEEFKLNIKTYDLEAKTILGLAYDVGFNSKSSFNRAFKKFNNISPTEYLQKIKTQ